MKSFWETYVKHFSCFNKPKDLVTLMKRKVCNRRACCRIYGVEIHVRKNFSF